MSWRTKGRGKKAVHYKADKKVRDISGSELEEIASVIDEKELEDFAKHKAEEIIEQNENGIKQIRKDDEELDHVVEVNGYEIEIPVDKDEYEVVWEFLEKNDLFEKIPIEQIKDDEVHSFGYRLEKSMVENVGKVDSPDGSVYLTTDGDWVGGIGAYGYDEDHRPQIRKGLVYAGLDIVGKSRYGDESISDSEEMDYAMRMTGMARVGARGNLNLDIVKPLTNSQKSALRDYIIENSLTNDDIVIDTNHIQGLKEENVLRQIGVNEDYSEEENYD